MTLLFYTIIPAGRDSYIAGKAKLMCIIQSVSWWWHAIALPVVCEVLGDIKVASAAVCDGAKALAVNLSFCLSRVASKLLDTTFSSWRNIIIPAGHELSEVLTEVKCTLTRWVCYGKVTSLQLYVTITPIVITWVDQTIKSISQRDYTKLAAWWLSEFTYFAIYFYELHCAYLRVWKNLARQVGSLVHLCYNELLPIAKDQKKVISKCANRAKCTIQDSIKSGIDDNIAPKIKQYRKRVHRQNCTTEIMLPVDAIRFGAQRITFERHPKPLQTVRSILLNRRDQAAHKYLEGQFSEFSANIFVREVQFRNGCSNLESDSIYQWPDDSRRIPSQYRTINPNDEPPPHKMYFAESGNEELWFLRIFAERRMVSHVRVSLIDDPEDHCKVVAKLLVEAKSLGIYDNPSLTGIHEATLYDDIYRLFESYQHLAKAYYNPPALSTVQIMEDLGRQAFHEDAHKDLTKSSWLHQCHKKSKYGADIHVQTETLYSINWRFAVFCIAVVCLIVFAVYVTELEVKYGRQ